MRYTVNFGRLAARRPRPTGLGKSLRIAVLGDFSGRANAQSLEIGPALATRKPQPVDIDNFQTVLRRLSPRLRLPIAPDGGSVELKIDSLDDFHPDQLISQLDLFNELSGLRRRLKNSATFSAAATEVRSWAALPAAGKSIPASRKSGSTSIPHGKLDDFARLLGRPASAPSPTPAQHLIKQIVGPHIVAAPSPEQEPLIAAVDEALAEAMRRVLHHPDFQALESIWRSTELLTRELETGPQMQIVLYDITAEELAADLGAVDDLEDSGLYRLLVEQPEVDGQSGPLSVLLANYIFQETPPHAELLGRIGKIAAAAEAPFIAAISADCIKRQSAEEVHPLILESWNTLRSMPHARYLGLTVPRFMLRWPYGQKTEPIESFRFEEFTSQSCLKGMLWANGAMLAGLLLGKTFTEQGIPDMRPGTIMSLDDVPFYYYTDANDDQVALPNTERLVTESTAAYLMSQNFMPILSIRGRPEVRLGSFQSLAGTELAGPWSPVAIEPDEKAPPEDAVEEPEQNIPTVEAYEAQAASEAESELDALLAGLLAESEAPVAMTDEADAGDLPDSTDPQSYLIEHEPTSEGATEHAGAPETPEEPKQSAGGSVDDLDTLLAGLASNQAESNPDNSQMDPELADILKNL
ncbi:MAG TPA: type VI secretion system contractile sheath large subunit [Lacipirellulaceae bacterium]|nr:type VI secretion system contractile sheath large subunit [Lacipirellulaceae bacterium]